MADDREDLEGLDRSREADDYEALLRTEIFPGIERRGIAGFEGIELYRRTAGAEAEFVTLMWFDSLQAVRDFAGPDYETAVVPPAARVLLKRFDERSAHYEVRILRVLRNLPRWDGTYTAFRYPGVVDSGGGQQANDIRRHRRRRQLHFRRRRLRRPVPRPVG